MKQKGPRRVHLFPGKHSDDYDVLLEEACRLRHLVGCIIEALEYSDSDDGYAELILAGILAEYKSITATRDSAETPKGT